MGVRRATTGDEETVRALRLQAMEESPAQFSSTYEREAARSIRDWRRWFSPGVTFISEDPRHGPNGLVAGVRDDADPGVVHLMAMWVSPPARGTGVGDALAAAVLSWGRQVGALAVRLRVIDHNAAARRLYGRHGFATTGHVVAAARDGGREAVEIEMEHRFPDPGPPRTGGDDEPAGGGPSAGSG